jgi:hypothetical protein
MPNVVGYPRRGFSHNLDQLHQGELELTVRAQLSQHHSTALPASHCRAFGSPRATCSIFYAEPAANGSRNIEDRWRHAAAGEALTVRGTDAENRCKSRRREPPTLSAAIRF